MEKSYDTQFLTLNIKQNDNPNRLQGINPKPSLFLSGNLPFFYKYYPARRVVCTVAIENAMSSGQYTDHNAIIHEAIALFERKQAEERLTQELQKGIDSGFDHNFDYPEWLRERNQMTTG